VSPKTLPRHARPLAAGRWAGRPAVGRWAGRIAERGLARLPADSRGLPGHPPGDAGAAPRRHDPLVDPLAITERCVIGDQLRMPATCCDIVGCGAEFSDLAALGEADNRARALAAGWRMDAFDRLVCPTCEQRPDAAWPRAPGPEPDTGADLTSAVVAPRPRYGESPPTRARIAGSHGTAGPGNVIRPGHHRRAPWLHVLTALANGDNGWAAPQPVTDPHRMGPPSNPAGPQTGAA
jgi:hypothetical protein